MLGLSHEIAYAAIAVSLHEAAHLAAARICGVEVEYVEMTCFGGALKLRDLYTSGRLKLICVALAGPLANLMASLAAAALAWWGIIGFFPASIMVRSNLILMLFNLMPALPLDGGRILYGISTVWLSESISLRICALASAALSLFLVILCIYGWFALGVFNITLVLMAVFVVSSTLRELDDAEEDGLRNTLAALSGVAVSGRVSVAVMPANAPLTAAAAYFDSRKPTVFAMVDNGIVREMITSDEMARRILDLN